MGLRRLFWLTVAGILVYGYLTDSRGSLLALLAVMGVYICSEGRVRGRLSAAWRWRAAGAAVALQRDRRRRSLGAGARWIRGTRLQMFQGHPLFGVGPDMYSTITIDRAQFVRAGVAETGIIGYTLWLRW